MYPNQEIGGGVTSYPENNGIGSGVQTTQPYPGNPYNPHSSNPQVGSGIGQGATSTPSYTDGPQPIGQGVGRSYPGNEYNAYNNDDGNDGCGCC
ncbi:hypothetical protein Y032_0042g553 [Ancylostoma ceylanicum]|uniref:Uncharacterized protein n=1 Tax=Ancylostoma ceylanicum TaxID=53326 RepID=A0A016UES6_9BILA|nr:hypothetical protein Y032_0042g553 [Ancylostoma ceylanicum]